MLLQSLPCLANNLALARDQVCWHASAVLAWLWEAPDLPRAETLEWVSRQLTTGTCPDFSLEEIAEQLTELGLWINRAVA